MLALWWFALQSPMLFALEGAESVALRLLSSPGSKEPVELDPSGDWNFRVPVEDTQRETNPASGKGGAPTKFRAIEFTIPRSDVVLFTFSVPVFWAIVLGAPLGKSSARALLWGTAVVAVVEVFSLLTLVEITAYAVVAQLHPSADGLAAWARDVGDKIVVGVIPFAAPVLVAVALHRDLRSQIFPESHPAIINADDALPGTAQGIQVQRPALDRNPDRDPRGRSR